LGFAAAITGDVAITRAGRTKSSEPIRRFRGGVTSGCSGDGMMIAGFIAGTKDVS
jgi:hypothetical protein